MSNNNGEEKLDLVQKTKVIAALALTDELSQVHMLLAQEGFPLSSPRLKLIQSGHLTEIQCMRESGLASTFFGPEAMRLFRLVRLDSVCTTLEARINSTEGPLDRELAAILQQYRELMDLALKQTSPAPAAASNSEANASVAATFTLLEALHDNDLPPGDSTQVVCDAARRMAAATGFAFAGADPAQPALAADARDLRAAAGSRS